MASGRGASSRWFFTREQLENTPSRRCGVEADEELSHRQQAANLIQDMGQRLNVRKTHAKDGESYDPYDFSEAETQMPQVHTPKTDDSQEKTDDSQETQDSQKVELSEPRLKAFKAALLEVFQEAHEQSVGMLHLTESINRNREEPFSSEEIQACLSRMQDDNQVMVSEGIVFLI